MTAPTLAPPCTANPDAWFRPPEERGLSWAIRPLATCYACPIRRPCIEDELAMPGKPNRDGMVRGGWRWSGRGATPHPADADLYARHYPRKAN